MAQYCGIDLHSNNHLVVVIDEQDKRLEERRLGNDLSLTLALSGPYRDELAGVAAESTFNWYWLVDGLQDAGYRVDLVNPAGIKQYEGLKYTGNRYDAFWLAQRVMTMVLFVPRISVGTNSTYPPDLFLPAQTKTAQPRKFEWF